MIIEEVQNDMRTAIEYGRTDIVKTILDTCKLLSTYIKLHTKAYLNLLQNRTNSLLKPYCLHCVQFFNNSTIFSP